MTWAKYPCDRLKKPAPSELSEACVIARSRYIAFRLYSEYVEERFVDESAAFLHAMNHGVEDDTALMAYGVFEEAWNGNAKLACACLAEMLVDLSAEQGVKVIDDAWAELTKTEDV